MEMMTARQGGRSAGEDVRDGEGGAQVGASHVSADTRVGA